MARAFFPPFGVTVLLLALLYAVIVLFGETQPDAPSKLVLVPAAFVFGAIVGVWPGVAIGGLRLSWRLVGAWTLLPLLLLPLALWLALWASGGWLTGLSEDILRALVAAGGEHEWLVLAVGPAARAGPVILVIALPLLVIDLGAILFDPPVLWSMFALVAAFGLVVALAVIPTALLSMLVLLRAYVVRLRARIEAGETSS